MSRFQGQRISDIIRHPCVCNRRHRTTTLVFVLKNASIFTIAWSNATFKYRQSHHRHRRRPLLYRKRSNFHSFFALDPSGIPSC
jgi:hypothetical protein